MTRTVPEWIGKTDDTPAPPRVRARVFLAHEGVCHITGRKIAPGEKWELDHVVALINGGENRESNLAPALVAAHKAKTAQDVAQKAKDARVRGKHIGAAPAPRRPLPGSKASGWKVKLDGTRERRG
jgi:5-methylcytosine-specific restriction protein A